MAAKRRKRLDALLALPLARFRRQLTDLSQDEQSALEQRIDLLTVRNRWALGGHGMERHRASGELGLLSRRRAAIQHERDLRAARTGASLRLLENGTNLVTMTTVGVDDRAA